MSEQRDELAREIFIADNYHARREFMEAEWAERSGGYQYAFWIADGLIAAGYRKPRTITTVEELDALPVGSVIRIQQEMNLEKFSDGWYTTALTENFQQFPIWLPATVLHEPAA